MKKFESLLKSEIKKINKAAQQRDNTDSVITGYSYGAVDEWGTITVTCEICSSNMNTRMDDLTFIVFMDDRRRSFVPKHQLNR